MGNYNPRVPIILGEEWVPIRSETLQLPANTAAFETGYRFTLAQSRTLDHACFYTDNLPGNAGVTPQCVNIYPAGTEAESGPIQSVIIPVNNAVVTGLDITAFGASSYAEALNNPDDSKWARLLYNASHASPQYLTVFFATNQYAQQLQGKRVLAVNLLYSGVGLVDPTEIPSLATIPVGIGNLLTSNFLPLGQLSSMPFYPLNNAVQTASPVSRFGLGDFTELNTASFTSSTEGLILPWRYVDLQRLELSNASPVGLTLTFSQHVASDNVAIKYLALEVIYCAEQRVAVSGKYFGQAAGGYNLGANVLPLYSTAGVAGPTLVAGDYTVTVTNGDTGTRNDANYDFMNVPPLNALRQYYALPFQRGLQINRTTMLGETFTVQEVDVLPQLSIHASGGTLTEPHVYGDQAGAPVYGAVTASQVIYDDAVSPAASYPQVRFYARRFGSTTVPLTLSTTSPTLSGSSVLISPSDLDALPEIIDGWREVTLQFGSAPSMGGLSPDPTWTWSAAGELIGNRWEVLLASAPALSGIPGNLTNTVRSVDLLGSATYQPTGGATVALTWLSPNVTAGALDAASDAVLLFSQDPPMITGLAVGVASLALTGFSDCTGDAGPCCVPSALQYHQITWSSPLPIQADRFQRTVAAGLGGTWSTAVTGGGSAANVNVGPGAATILGPGTYSGSLPQSYTDVDEQMDLVLPALTSGTGWTADLTLRRQDDSNYYLLRLAPTGTLGAITAQLGKVVAGALTTLSSALVLPFAAGAATAVTLRMSVTGTTLRGKAWLKSSAEPDWQLSSFGDAAFSSGTSGFRFTPTGAQTLTVTRYLAAPAGLCGASIELQRMDPLTGWQTIMASTLADVVRFYDYEARVGLLSSYRVRVVNALGFAGSWSSTVTSTITDPGVTLPSCGSGRRGVLIFTSNAGQAGQYALAYPPVWDQDQVSEDFNFPEASDVSYTQQYGRDFAVAFHGTERGGETFQRRLLLANAATASPHLAGAVSLRDLAWANLPYVCVRDDVGDRWFASVLVPGDQVRRVRRLYNADVTVVEVTQTAAPVAP